jgi:hypothetical protein
MSYRGALLSALLHATVYVFTQLLRMYLYRLQIKWDYKKEDQKSIVYKTE